MAGSTKTPENYLKEPYARVLTPDEEAGGYTAEILEFPGCVTEGDTADEALSNLEDAAAGWIEATLNSGREVPEPSAPSGYGGRVALRLPRSLHRRAMQMAERDGTSLNQFLVSAIAERVGAGTLYAQMTQQLGEQVAQAVAGPVQATMDSAVEYIMRNLRFHLYAHESTPAHAGGSWLLEGGITGLSLVQQGLAETPGHVNVLHGPDR